MRAPDAARQRAADEAEALLANPTLLAAHDAVREALVKRMVEGDVSAETDHEVANLMRASALWWKMLRGYLRTGEVELHNIEQRNRSIA